MAGAHAWHDAFWPERDGFPFCYHRDAHQRVCNSTIIHVIMKHPAHIIASFLIASSVLHAGVRLERVPEGGVQPQVATGADGSVHLVYLKGDPRSSDVRYTYKASGAKEWGAPVTVNSEPSSAIAIGTIRGAQLAIGRDNSVHVVWNGPQQKQADGKQMKSSLNYARLDAGGSAFTPQRDLIGGTRFLDGGASVAANAKGEVFVVWHALASDSTPGEINRKVFMAKSTDNGATFSAAKMVNEASGGVCACCSLKAFAAPSGELFTLYRAARSMTQRDITLASSRDDGGSFTQQTLHPWSIGACPMSSAAIISSDGRTRAAWETEGKIYSSTIGETFSPQLISERAGRHPALATNAKGETLVAWSVGTGWQKGGTLAWRMLDASGRPAPESGKGDGVPVWSHTAAFATQDNDFIILH